MVRASARFLLFTRTAVIIEIWGRHDIEPTLRKSTNPVLHQLGILCIMPITAPFALPLGYGCSPGLNLEKNIDWKTGTSFLSRWCFFHQPQ